MTTFHAPCPSYFGRFLLAVLLLLIACGALRVQAQPSDPSSHTATLLAYYEAMHQQDWEEVAALTHPEGIEALAPHLRQMLHAFEVAEADTLEGQELYATFLELGGGLVQAFDFEGVDVTPSTHVLGFIEAEGDTTYALIEQRFSYVLAEEGGDMQSYLDTLPRHRRSILIMTPHAERWLVHPPDELKQAIQGMLFTFGE